jgi:teichuronic acid exporter
MRFHADRRSVFVGGRPDLYLRLELAKRLIGLTVTLVMLPFGMLALAWGLLISGIMALVIISVYAGRLMHYAFKAQLKDVAGYFGASILAAGAVWWTLPLLPDVDVLRIAAGGVIFVVIAGGAGCLISDNAYIYAWRQFKDKT